ncbi:MAG: hypothetical protein U9Q70_01765 [Chloroflexota bacterium]|nr:hypothetical protein [Chloroflexota bacterium]
MVLAALATLTRSDGVSVAGLLGLEALLRQRKFPWRMALVYGALISPWYSFSWLYFGSLFPVTLATKQHQANMAISAGFARGFLTVLKPYALQPLYWLHAAFFLLGTGYAFAKAHRWLLLLAWGGLYFLGYTVLGVSRYFWYYAPLVPVIIMLVGLGIKASWRRLFNDWQHDWHAWTLLALLLSLMLWPQVKSVYWLSTHNDQRTHIYQAIGAWLAANTPPDAPVGALEVGIIGYYARRPMVGFAGLIQPDVAAQMQRKTTYQDTALWAVEHYRPEYLVLSPDWFPQLISEFVNDACTVEQTFSDPDYAGELAVYRCHWLEH